MEACVEGSVTRIYWDRERGSNVLYSGSAGPQLME